MLTPRLEVRLPGESDRGRFVELFCDEHFMVFSSGVLTATAAHERFDEMLVRAAELSFAKQPVIERPSKTIVGYAGVNWCELEGLRRLEFGWRLVPEARGLGYATEAGRVLLDLAAETFQGEILAIIDPLNHASRGVALKLGFTFSKQATEDGYLVDLFRYLVGPGASG